ncbi:MAG: TonB family protein [Betaproteobacteria bacterium]|nr:MAG: TonB family protein [Betaproteobacteria bacterium]
MLSVHFKFPAPLQWKAANQPLEVVLVNAKTREKPAQADVLAQANLDRGGNVDERRRAKTPLPVIEPRRPGKDLADAQRRVQQLEVRQQRLLAQAQEAPSRVPVENPRAERADQPSPHPAGRDLADLSLAAMRLQAQIDKQIEEYQKRPRKKFIGARATEYRFAQYEEDWRVKVERVGTLNYPAEARGKMYGNLRLTVTIRPDGNVESIELDRSSGLKVLDAAAFKIVRMATPFAAFPPDIRRDTDLLVITRTWFFGQGDKIWTE